VAEIQSTIARKELVWSTERVDTIAVSVRTYVIWRRGLEGPSDIQLVAVNRTAGLRKINDRLRRRYHDPSLWVDGYVSA
jgi:hypothetical protein